jgi:transposase
VSCIRNIKPAKKMEGDWIGATMIYVGRTTGEIKTADIFVAVLSASSYPFVYAFEDLSISNWIEANVKAFKYF